MVVVALLACSSAGTRVAYAAPSKEASRAEQLFDEGTRLLDEKRYSEALPMLLESQRLGPGVGVTMYLADCYDGLGRTAKALALFREAAQMARARRDSRDALANSRADELAARVPSVVVRVTEPVESGLVVTLDDEALEKARWSRSIEMDPGPHVLKASAGGRRWETSFELPSRASTTMLQIARLDQKALVPAAAAPVRNDAVSPLRVAGIAQMTGGAILLGTGLLFGYAAIRSQSSSYDAGHCDHDAHCDDVGLERRLDGLSSARVATALVTIGVLAAVSGTVCYLLDVRRSSRHGTLMGAAW
jgi:hypothetical protein